MDLVSEDERPCEPEDELAVGVLGPTRLLPSEILGADVDELDALRLELPEKKIVILEEFCVRRAAGAVTSATRARCR